MFCGGVNSLMSSSSARSSQSRRVADGILGSGLLRLACRCSAAPYAAAVDVVMMDGARLVQPEVCVCSEELVWGRYMEGIDRKVDCVRGGLIGVGMPGIDGAACICITRGESGRPGDASPESSTAVTSQKSLSMFFVFQGASAARCWLSF